MKKILFFGAFIPLILATLFSVNNARASHISGGNFEWTCLGPDTFLIRLRLFRDCGGATLTSPPAIQFNSPCGTFNQHFTRVGGIVEVSQLCPSQLPNSTCNNGSLPGMEEHVFESVVIFPQPCSLWTMSVNICCRNTQRLGNITGGPFELHAQINTAGGAGNCPNNSPIFSATPIPYVCANQQVFFSPNVHDPDGDSLVYSVVVPQPSQVNYSPGNPSAPFGTHIPYSFDPTTGQVVFTPDIAMVSSGPAQALVIRVCKYRSNLLLGCVDRDFQFVIQICNNIQPTLRDSGFTDLQGHHSLLDSTHLTVCEGNRLQFDLVFIDSLHPNQPYGDSITLTTNITNVFPGANIQITNGNPAIISFDWVASAGGASTRSFTVSLEDDACPIPGIGAYNFTVSRLFGTFGPDAYICNDAPDSVLLQGFGGNRFFWSSISGTPINIGQNFSDTTGTNGSFVWAKPDTTSQYLVQSNLISACDNFDTVTVHVNNFQLNTDDTTLCAGDTLEVDIDAPFFNATLANHVTWTPSQNLNDPNSLSPKIHIDPGHGNQFYTVAYNDGYCSFGGSFWINHEPLYIDSINWHKPGCGDSNAHLTAFYTAPPNSAIFSLDTTLGYQDTNYFAGLPVDYYTVYLKDTVNNCVTSAVDTIHDRNAPVIYEDSAIVTHASCLGQNTGTIEVVAAGGAPPLMFSIDNGLNYSATNIFTNLATANYTVRVVDNDSCFALPGTVSVYGDTLVTIDSISKRDLTCHDDNSGFLKIFAENGNAYKQFSVDSGQTWHNTGNILNLAAGEYTVLGRDSTFCYSLPSIVSLSEPEKLSADLNLQHDSCNGACGGRAYLAVTGGVPGYTYNWNGHGANNPQSWNLCAQTYLVEVTDDSACTFDTAFVIREPDLLTIDSVKSESPACYASSDGSIEIFASGGTSPLNYSVNAGDRFTYGRRFMALERKTYRLLVVDSASRCSTDITPFLLESPGKVELSTNFSNKTICVSNCENISASASGGFPPYDYTWTHTGDSGSTVQVCPEKDEVYAVFAQDANGCISEVKTIELNLFDSLRIFTENYVEICPNEETFLSAYAEGGTGGGYTFSWTPGTGLSRGYGQSITASPPATTTYTLHVSDECGSSPVSDTVRVQILEVAPAEFVVSDTNEGCEPFTCVLTNKTPDTKESLWNISDNQSYYGNSVTLSDLPAGKYNVSLNAVTVNNCTTTLTKNKHLIVHEKPRALFRFENGAMNEHNNAITVRNETQPTTAEYKWLVDGDYFSNLKNPIFDFTGSPGEYEITLFAKTDYECESEYNKRLIINPAFNLFVPNAFTPNADGLNDVFAPIARGTSADAFDIQIYNRWGTAHIREFDIGHPLGRSNQQSPRSIGNLHLENSIKPTRRRPRVI